MDRPDAPLTHFLHFDGRSLTRRQLDALDASAAMSELRRRVELKLAPSLWPRAIGEAIGEALNVRLADLLVAGWNRYRELSKYTDRDRYPPDQINEVALAQHRIATTHEPRVAIVVDGATVAEIHLRIDLTIDLEGAILKIQDARIKEAALGACEVSGTLRCEGIDVADAERAFTLPGTVSFGDGIPLV